MRFWRTGIDGFGRVFCVVLAVSIAGCSGEGTDGVAPAFRKEYNTPANLGSLVVLLDRTEIATTDAIHLELVAEAPLSVKPIFPGLRWNGRPWTVVEASDEERSVLPGGRVKTRKVYTVEPFLAGDFVIPAFKVRFVEPGKEATVVMVEPIPVTVSSVLEGDPAAMELEEPYDEVPVPMRGIWWVIGGAIGILLIFGVWVFVAMRRPVAFDHGLPEPRRMLIRELDGLLKSEGVDVARLSAIAGRVGDLPEGFAERIEGLAFSEREAGDESVRGVAKELRGILNGRLKGGAG